jgi:hypothetical protein
MLANRTSGKYVYEMSGHPTSKGYGRIEVARGTETISASFGPSDEMLYDRMVRMSISSSRTVENPDM